MVVIDKPSGMEIEVDGNDTIIEHTNRMKESILESVSKSKGFFKSQQVGEIDLTLDEKRIIAIDILDSNVPLFLQRYWQYIKLEDIDFFGSSDNYEVNFYLTEIRKFRDSRRNRTQVKNRRLGALRKLVKEGTYFSDGEMKKRNPFMFEQLVGQHMTESERIEAYKLQNKDGFVSFSGFLMGQIERNVENCLFNEQKCEDETVEEENDTDDNDSAEEESELEDEPPKPVPIDSNEKSRLKSEFTNIMYESFLSGKDIEFDYSSVDYNAEYDPIEGDLDAEEKYFDEDVSD